MKRLLDTNAYTAMRRGDEPVADLVRGSTRLIFSAVVAGELLYGFRHGRQTERNIKSLRAFLDSPFVEFVDVTWATADRFGRIATELRKRGKPIPTNDIWIAAQAAETGAELVTFDGHFSYVPGLVVHHLTV
jgi:tRNA(fMet)-specific endonuclease VapC